MVGLKLPWIHYLYWLMADSSPLSFQIQVCALWYTPFITASVAMAHEVVAKFLNNIGCLLGGSGLLIDGDNNGCNHEQTRHAFSTHITAW